MENKDTTKLTSVKILTDNYYNFKNATLKTDLTLQKFVNRAIDLYLNNQDFKNKIDTHETGGVKNSKF
jgi:hypothetical protein